MPSRSAAKQSSQMGSSSSSKIADPRTEKTSSPKKLKKAEHMAWNLKRKNKYNTLWENSNGEFVDVRKMSTHGGYNPKSAWYVFSPNNKSDLNADFVTKSRIKAEQKARTYMR